MLTTRQLSNVLDTTAQVVLETELGLRKRIHELEVVLNRMVLAHENTMSESDGQWPQPDTGCIECTVGTVPDKYNTGPCAYHSAKRLLGQS
jgi:hypothetical protein